MLLENPVRGTLHGSGWKRPAGNDDFRLTQDFGPSSLSVEPTVFWPGGEGIPRGTYANFHRGIDLGNGGCGADVLAARSGRVAFAGIDGTGNRVVIIDHGDGFRTWYGHLGSEKVSVGQRVDAKQEIGLHGQSAASACHLHFALEVNHGNGGDFEWADPWRRLYMNVRVRLVPSGADGINLRTAPKLDDATRYAVTQNGRIVRISDDADLGDMTAWRAWGRDIAGDSYTVGPITSNRWRKVRAAGRYLYVAVPLTQLSQT